MSAHRDGYVVRMQRGWSHGTRTHRIRVVGPPGGDDGRGPGPEFRDERELPDGGLHGLHGRRQYGLHECAAERTDGYVAPNGANFFAFVGPVRSDGTLSQTLALPSAGPYTFSFYYGSDGYTPSDFSAIFDGTTVLSLVDQIDTRPYLNYYSYLVTASSTTPLSHACCAMLCGCRGYAAIAQWGRDQPIELMHQLGYRRRPPSYGAFQSLLSRLDAGGPRGRPGPVGRPTSSASRPPPASRAVALDGKTSRGSLGPHAAGGPPPGGDGPADRLRPGPDPRPRQDQRAQGRPGAAGGPGPGGAGRSPATRCSASATSRRQVVAGGRPLPLEGRRQPAVTQGRPSRRPSSRPVPPYGRRLQAAEPDRRPDARTPTATGSRRRTLAATTMLDGYLDWPGVAQVVPGPEREVKVGGEETVRGLRTRSPASRAGRPGRRRCWAGIGATGGSRTGCTRPRRDDGRGHQPDPSRARARRCWRRCGTLAISQLTARRASTNIAASLRRNAARVRICS